MNNERYPVRCRECGQVIAVREGNKVSSTMRYRNRKKEIRIRLEAGQRMDIVCDRCGADNQIIGG